MQVGDQLYSGFGFFVIKKQTMCSDENLSDTICLCVSLTENAPVQDCTFLLHLLSSCGCQNQKKEQGGAKQEKQVK